MNTPFTDKKLALETIGKYNADILNEFQLQEKGDERLFLFSVLEATTPLGVELLSSVITEAYEAGKSDQEKQYIETVRVAGPAGLVNHFAVKEARTEAQQETAREIKVFLEEIIETKVLDDADKGWNFALREVATHVYQKYLNPSEGETKNVEESCWSGDEPEGHRCSFLHCNHCGKCPQNRADDSPNTNKA